MMLMVIVMKVVIMNGLSLKVRHQPAFQGDGAARLAGRQEVKPTDHLIVVLKKSNQQTS